MARTVVGREKKSLLLHVTPDLSRRDQDKKGDDSKWDGRNKAKQKGEECVVGLIGRSREAHLSAARVFLCGKKSRRNKRNKRHCGAARPPAADLQPPEGFGLDRAFGLQ